MKRKIRVAFICVHNSCRSQIAEAISKIKYSDFFESYSGGTQVKKTINQDVADIIKQRYDLDITQSQRPKLIGELPQIDILITMGCNVNCPYLPCIHREDWGLEDPTGKGREAFEKTVHIIEEKLQNLKQFCIDNMQKFEYVLSF